MATCNTVDLSDAMTLLWKKKCTGQLVEIDPDSLPNVNESFAFGNKLTPKVILLVGIRFHLLQ